MISGVHIAGNDNMLSIVDQAQEEVSQSKLAIVLGPQTNYTKKMDDHPSREEIDAKLEASEARGETKFATLLGEVRIGFAELRGSLTATNARLDHISATQIEEKAGRRNTNALVIATGIGVVALVIAALSLGSTQFGNGFTAHDVATSAAKQAIEQYRSSAAPSPPQQSH